ncbi:MAG: glycine--tRNA ligase subunit alpha [Holosporales bacterium]|jgi:glycyl-tRNA synthetase alpha chain|nr:glycine--tRNA ligase subunit alpha [Holosporales bacterium]
MISFQDIIFRLQKFWDEHGCAILQPYDTEVGAGTSHYATTLKALDNQYWAAAFVQPCRRPKDGRYADNPNRTQYYYQFQVIIKPAPANPQELYLDSLKAVGFDMAAHDIRFVEDDWENPSLGAAGLGWEVWCDGMEITQYTYFQQVGGINCSIVPVEITYGLERIATFMQGVESHFDINWNGKEGDQKLTYGDVLLRFEREFSCYNFDAASIDILSKHFEDYEVECRRLLAHNLVMPAYEQCIKANHGFNLLDARGIISVTERAGYIARVRALAKSCCQAWVESL